MKRRLFSLLIQGILLTLFYSTSNAQENISISVTPTNPDLSVFFLNDFNLTGKGSVGTDLFLIEITNDSPQTETCSIEMKIEAGVSNPVELAYGITDPFEIGPNEHILITNQNLFNYSDKFSLKDYRIAESGDDLVDKILRTGKLPSDIYKFQFKLIKQTNNQTDVIGPEEFIIDVTNPTTLDLISPGSDANTEEIQQIFSLQPFFRWESNMEEFRLVIAEKLAGIHENMSPEEILSDRVIFDKTLIVSSDPAGPDKIVISTTAFQYPAAGAFPLQPGRTYIWQITGIAQSSGAPVELPSEIWAFKIGSLEGGAMSFDQIQILDQLRLLLGDRYDALFESGGDLFNFKPTGVLYLNGQAISLDTFRDLLLKFQNGELQITNEIEAID